MEPNQLVNIDFEKMRETFPAFVREKAIKAGSTIVYMEDGEIIEEDPRTGKKTVLHKSRPSK